MNMQILFIFNFTSAKLNVNLRGGRSSGKSIIGAKPHTSRFNGHFVYMYIYVDTTLP
jgi:hypothetical protein